MRLPPAEQLLASAIQYLIQGDEKDAALVLSFCDASYTEWRYLPKNEPLPGFPRPGDLAGISVNLLGPRAAYDAFRRAEQGERISDEFDAPEFAVIHPVADAVKDAFEAVTPPGLQFKGVEMKVQLVDIPPGWREELQEIAQGRKVHNQGVDIPGGIIVEWNWLRFRSKTETLVAKELDTMGVLFLPNCLARLNRGEGRITKEADFLVCHNGKWGILEVDGPFHPRAATDHERDRLFQQHGIKVTQRFTAEECYTDAPGVVRRFLILLEKNG